MSLNPQQTLTILNTPCILTSIDRLTSDLSAYCRDRNSGQKPLSVDFSNVHIVAMRSADRSFYEDTASVDWFVPDSQVLSWGITLLGGRSHSRVYGPDFLAYYFRNGDPSLSHYFLGGSQECLDLLELKLKEIQPGFVSAGRQNGYFSDSQWQDVINNINLAEPDIVWVGLGTPKQQQWIHANKDRLRCGALLAVGFAFDVNAGTKKDAPSWLGPLGLTWAFRLLKEPRRLWRRYLIYNSIYVWRLAAQAIFGRRYDAP